MNGLFINILEIFSNQYILLISTIAFGISVALSVSLKSKEKSVLFASLSMVLEIGPVSYLTFMNLLENEFYNPKSPLKILYILMAAGFLIGIYIMSFLKLYKNLEKIDSKWIKYISIGLGIISVFILSNLIVNLLYIILRFIKIIKGVYY